MIDLSSLPRASLAGKLFRSPLKLLPDGTRVRILQGPLKGKKWISGSATHGCWLGCYEMAKQNEIRRRIRPGWTCWDIGANVGFYSLLFSELVGPRGAVVAFEPLDRNFSLLARHVEMNRYTNVRLERMALGDVDAEVGFNEGSGCGLQGFLDSVGSIRVPCRRIDSLLASGAIPVPNLIKVDVEGTEAAVLRGGALLARYRPIILLATHGWNVHAECISLLERMGYSVSYIGQVPINDELLAIPRVEATSAVCLVQKP